MLAECHEYSKMSSFSGKIDKMTIFRYYRHRSASRVMKMERYGSVTGALHPKLSMMFLKKSSKSVKKFSKPLNTVKVSTQLNLNYFR